MSINDLIHTNARHAYEQGVKTEQERIIGLLEYLASANSKYCTIPLDRNHCQSCWATADTIAFIKGEQK